MGGKENYFYVCCLNRNTMALFKKPCHRQYGKEELLSTLLRYCPFCNHQRRGKITTGKGQHHPVPSEKDRTYVYQRYV